MKTILTLERKTMPLGKIVKLRIVLTLACLLIVMRASANSQPTPATGPVKLVDVRMRDVYILRDDATKLYYAVSSTMAPVKDGYRRAAVRVYSSKDLLTWTGPQVVFQTPLNFWGDVNIRSIWAPEMHAYQGKYYLFLTFDTDAQFPEQWRDWLPRVKRGSQVLVSDSPLGPFKPFQNHSTLPIDMMTLDGTLWIEDGVPYMVYCHEWVQIKDGTVEMIRLKDDLSETVGAPLRLFDGSDAVWSKKSPQYGCHVTDGPYLYQSRSGKLMMIWSSGGARGYTTGVAVSISGKLRGPWIQQTEPLFADDGGHGMIFKRFDGQLMLVLHQPNKGGLERARMFELDDTGETLRIRNPFPATVTGSAVAAPALAEPAADFPVRIQINAAQAIGELKPVWRFFGADEPNYAYMKDGRKLVRELGQLRPQSVYFRTHNLLTSGDGTPALKWGSTNAYTEDAHGKPVYDWKILDRIFDTYLQRGVRPYVQIGFMPQALSVKPDPYQHSWTPTAQYDEIYTGWAYPPKDYHKWSELIYRWARHCVVRYGRAEVERWYWEVWNEANIGYWRGTPEEFRKLHDYAIAAVRRALPTAKVGGPDTAGSGGQFMRDFLEHCLRGTNYANGKPGTPLDFISFHAKGAPKFVDGHVQLGIANQLRAIDSGFAIIASYPELKRKPIVIGESDPDGCAACQGPQLGYRNSTMYSSYTAASFARAYDLADRRGVNLEGVLTWAFEFENQPYFAGFRVLATNGIAQPVLNVFRMFSKMSGKRIGVESDTAVPLDVILKDGVRRGADVSAFASLDRNRLFVLVWHYHDDDVPGPAANASISLENLPLRQGRARLREYRVDDAHSNAFTAWQRMGSPASPTPQRYAALVRAGNLMEVPGPRSVMVNGGLASVQLHLPRQAVSLLVLEWGRDH